MNIEQMLIETLNDDDAWGQSRWTDPVARIAERYRRRRRRRLALVGTVAAVVVALGAVAGVEYWPGHSDALVTPVHPPRGAPDVPISRTLQLYGQNWTVNASPASAGGCGALSVGRTTVAQGCGPAVSGLVWAVGEMLEPPHYRFAYGRAPAGAIEVRVQDAQGKVLVDDNLTGNGLWLVVRAGHHARQAERFKTVTAFDSTGREVARRHLTMRH